MQQKIVPDEIDVALLAAIEDGLPLCQYPYAEIADTLNIGEGDVIRRLKWMQNHGIISRFGLVLQHRPLGYKANAMVVFDVPDETVDEIASRITAHEFITLCYCRSRQAPDWPYNLYCMIHGRERKKVKQQIVDLKCNAGLNRFPSQTLFSRRRFKQTGARFSPASKLTKEVL